MSPWRIFQYGEDHKPLPFRVLVSFVFLIVAFTLSIAAVSFGIKENRERIDDIQKVADAVCNLRADQIRRIRVTEQFIREHPEGFAGIPNSVLRRDLVDRRKVVDALSPLNCSA